MVSPRIVDAEDALLKMFFTNVKPLITFATPLASKPNVIRNIGPIPAIRPVALITNCFTPLSMLLKAFRISVPN